MGKMSVCDKKKGYVYLLADASKDRTYKIGVTTGTIERRIKKLQTGNSGEIYLVSYYQTDHPFFTESRLHQRFFKDNIINEWFELSDEDALKFKDYCKDVDVLVESLKDNPFFPKKLK